MALTQKEISSKEQELNALFGIRRREILNLEKSLRVLEGKKSSLEKDILTSQKNFNSHQNKMKDAQINLRRAEVEAKVIISEAREQLTSAQKQNSEARDFSFESQKELGVIKRKSKIADQAKEELRKNVEKGKDLDARIDFYRNKSRKLEALIALKKDVDSDKTLLEENNSILDGLIGDSKKKLKELDESIEETRKDRKRLEDKIRQESDKINELEEMEKDFEVKLESCDAEREKLKNDKAINKEINDRVVENLETQRRLQDSKEKKLEKVIEKIKKSKKFDDDLKLIGL